MLDSRKLGKVAAYTFARLPQIDTVITDRNAPRDLVKLFIENKIQVELV